MQGSVARISVRFASEQVNVVRDSDGKEVDGHSTAAEEVIDEIRDQLSGAHMVFITAGMGGGTGTGAAPVIARAAREMGILTVGVVTKPFQFEGVRRARVAEAGVAELQQSVDTLIVIPNQNLFRVANEKTTFADAFAMADQVLYSGVACITDLMVKEGLINLDFADVRAVMREMGKAMMGTGEASGEKRALTAAEAFPPRFRNTCGSTLAPEDAVKIGASYEATEDKIARVEGFVSETGESAEVRARTRAEADAWYASSNADILS